MILLLSKHLRYVMDYKRETTSLRDETNFCQNYMEMTGIGQNSRQSAVLPSAWICRKCSCPP